MKALGDGVKVILRRDGYLVDAGKVLLRLSTQVTDCIDDSILNPSTFQLKDLKVSGRLVNLFACLNFQVGVTKQ